VKEVGVGDSIPKTLGRLRWQALLASIFKIQKTRRQQPGICIGNKTPKIKKKENPKKHGPKGFPQKRRGKEKKGIIPKP